MTREGILLLAYLSAVAAALAACAALVAVAREGLPRGSAHRLGASLRTLAEQALRREPLDRASRRRLAALFAVCGLAVGLVARGAWVGVAGALLAPWLWTRLRSWRARRYRAQLERQLPEIALALANALSGGHALRAAVAEAAFELDGPAGVELKRVAAQLATGAPTDAAVEGFRRRSRSRQVDLLVGAVTIQRRSGGDLAGLLREVTYVAEDRRRALDDARGASAQARFTGKLVVAMPFAAAALVELAAPGFIARLLGTFVSAWLLALAVVLQVLGALAIRRIARVETR